jgi:hypothetical protein
MVSESMIGTENSVISVRRSLGMYTASFQLIALRSLIVMILWNNGKCGLRDHDCRAKMEARQGRGGATRQQNNQTTEHQQDIGIS